MIASATKTARVFMLAPHDKNVSRAKRYGELEMIYDRDESRPSIWDEAMYDEALERLAELDYDPNHDYILIAGTMVPVVTFVARLVAEYGQIKTLCYDMVSGEYAQKLMGNIANEPNRKRTVHRRS